MTQNTNIQKRGGNDVIGLLQRMQPEIERALPRHVDADRMARIALTALRATPKLQRCTVPSLLGCILSAAQLGLEPNTPLQHCYLIPRKNECTLLIGYQGMIDLARRSGEVADIYAHVVREGDEFSWELGLERKLMHKPLAEHGAPVTHAYGVAHLRGSDHPAFVVLTKSEIEARKSRGAGGPAWRSDYEAMAMKSAIRALWPWLPKSAEMALAAEIEDAPMRGGSTFTPDVTQVLRAGGIEQPETDQDVLDALNEEFSDDNFDDIPEVAQ